MPIGQVAEVAEAKSEQAAAMKDALGQIAFVVESLHAEAARCDFCEDPQD